MTVRIILIALLVAILAIAAHEALAQTKSRCGDRVLIVDQLAKNHQERQVSYGITTSGQAVLEVYASEEGTWTVIMSAPNGMSCIVATGTQWQVIENPGERV